MALGRNKKGGGAGGEKELRQEDGRSWGSMLR